MVRIPEGPGNKFLKEAHIIKGRKPKVVTTELPLSTGIRQLESRLEVGGHRIVLVRSSGERVCWVASHETKPDFGIVVCVVYKSVYQGRSEYAYYRDFLANITVGVLRNTGLSAFWHLKRYCGLMNRGIRWFHDLEEALRVIKWYPPKTHVQIRSD